DKFLDGGEQNYAADNLTADPEGNDPSNTLYAIWKIQTYTVKVKKVINNLGVADSSWDSHGFRFYYSISNGGEYDVTNAFVTDENGLSVNDGEVTIENVPYGSTLSVWEVLSVEESAVFTTDHDADHKFEIEDVTEEKLAETIAVTNTRVTGKITVVKTVVDGEGGVCDTEFPTEKFIFKLERLNSAGTEVDDTFTAVYYTLYANK
ncbi:MAG: hypothetical protein IKX49_02810, partial [Clostridia bacterium]|nr:hypothetical protein [Clostridia bacterium]